MPITYVDYTATAAQTDFAFSFPYLEDEHVIVQIDGSATTDFTIVTTPSTKIVLNVGATAGQVVRVSRVSQPDQNLVDFVNGSVLTESELDRAYLHNRYLAEESAEQNDVSLRVKEGAAGWDGLNKRLLNLANPVADQDAATKDYVDDVVGSVAVGTLPDDSVTYAKIQEVAANNVLLGNDNGTNQNVQELTAAEVRTVLNVEDGANNFSLADNAVTSAKISDSDNTFKVSATDVVVNEGGADVDFRVEGDNNTNLINANGQNDIVGIGMEPDATNVFGTTTFKAQVKDGAFIENDTGIAKLKLLTNKTGGGSASITLQSTTPPSTNEGHYSVFIGGANGRLNFVNETTSNGVVMDNTGTLTIDGILNLVNLGTYADDTAAGAGGLGTGDVYKTATGELRIKL
jgi:hypothetical protein|tara:strand:- start:219 stop:1427 length:1209 start_codon:yes stop_codon:yes gene_type:complete